VEYSDDSRDESSSLEIVKNLLYDSVLDAWEILSGPFGVFLVFFIFITLVGIISYRCFWGNEDYTQHMISDIADPHDSEEVMDLFQSRLKLKDLFRAYADGTRSLCFLKSIEFLLGKNNVLDDLRRRVANRTISFGGIPEGLFQTCCERITAEFTGPEDVHFRAISATYNVNIVVFRTAIKLPDGQQRKRGKCISTIELMSDFVVQRPSIILHRREVCDADDLNSNGHYEPVIQLDTSGNILARSFNLPADIFSNAESIQVSSYEFDNFFRFNE
jgi:hypothetical protein